MYDNCLNYIKFVKLDNCTRAPHLDTRRASVHLVVMVTQTRELSYGDHVSSVRGRGTLFLSVPWQRAIP